jgi:hypothetical protein
MKHATAAWVVVALLVGVDSCLAQDSPVVEPKPVANNHELLRKYVWSPLGAEGAISATLASSFEQWRDAPPEWGNGVPGYAKRWASEFAELAIIDTTKYAVARMLHQDPSFTRCECTGFGPRLHHALRSAFVARTRDGRTVLSPATVAGLAAGYIVPTSTWYPAPNGARDGLAYAGAAIAGKVGVNVLREFMSELKAKIPSELP